MVVPHQSVTVEVGHWLSYRETPYLFGTDPFAGENWGRHGGLFGRAPDCLTGESRFDKFQKAARASCQAAPTIGFAKSRRNAPSEVHELSFRHC